MSYLFPVIGIAIGVFYLWVIRDVRKRAKQPGAVYEAINPFLPYRLVRRIPLLGYLVDLIYETDLGSCKRAEVKKEAGHDGKESGA